MSARGVGVAIFALIPFVGLAAARGRGESPTFSVVSVSVNEPRFQPKGAGSCSATACHGGVRPATGRILRNEHTVWITRDHHAEAYQTLLGPRSKAIAAKLGGRLPAHRDPRCLGCHAGSSTSETPIPEAILRDGVSCETCHGPAEKWLSEHTLESWSDKSVAEKQTLGMYDTKGLASRARLCAGCHVGEPGRDVDHDLIAAGHPRLTFELRAFHAQVPRHWRIEGSNESAPDSPARLWELGRLADAVAALELLAHRVESAAEAGKSGRPARFPELSEYGCFACHHELRDRPVPNRPATPLGALPWRTWEFAHFDDVLRDESLSKQVELLSLAMGKPRPDLAVVGRTSRELVAKLKPKLDAAASRSWSVSDLKQAQESARRLPENLEWDASAQRYLRMEAIHQAIKAVDPSRADDAESAELQRLRNFLNFPKGFDSPRGFPGDPSR